MSIVFLQDVTNVWVLNNHEMKMSRAWYILLMLHSKFAWMHTCSEKFICIRLWKSRINAVKLETMMFSYGSNMLFPFYRKLSQFVLQEKLFFLRLPSRLSGLQKQNDFECQMTTLSHSDNESTNYHFILQLLI